MGVIKIGYLGEEKQVMLQEGASASQIQETIRSIFLLEPHLNLSLVDPSGIHHVISPFLPSHTYTLLPLPLPKKETPPLPPRINTSLYSQREKENMLAGRLYVAGDLLLLLERERCRRLMLLLNQSPVPPVLQEGQKGRIDLSGRREIYRELFFENGEEELQTLYIEPPFYCDYGYNIKLGKNVYMNYNCVILDCSQVKIGSNTLLGPNVSLYSATHPLDAKSRVEGPELAYPIEIGENCWLGGGSTVLPGVKIGNNCVIAAGAVVTKDVPDNSVVAGCPAKVVKQLS